jgi:hypothetical protein
VKHYTAVLGVFRNEASFMSSWLEHYFSRDIDHIFLLNDRSVDNFYTPTFVKYFDDGRITLKHVAAEDCDPAKPDRQIYLYNKYFGAEVREAFWLGVLDLDEFYYSPEVKSISTLLREYEQKPCYEVIADWYWFGSNGYVTQPADIVGSFLKRSQYLAKTYKYDVEGYHHKWCCKSFGKTAAMTSIQHHFNAYSYGSVKKFCSRGENYYRDLSVNLSIIGRGYINHYVGAHDYYAAKEARGSCNNSGIMRNAELYAKVNKNDVTDTRLAEQTYG